MAIIAERHYTVNEVAKLWGISYGTARRIFMDEPGVLRICLPQQLSAARKHKPHVSLRIPESLLERLYREWTTGFSLKVKSRRGGV